MKLSELIDTLVTIQNNLEDDFGPQADVEVVLTNEYNENLTSIGQAWLAEAVLTKRDYVDSEHIVSTYRYYKKNKCRTGKTYVVAVE